MFSFRAFMDRLRTPETPPPWTFSRAVWLLIGYVALIILVTPLITQLLLSLDDDGVYLEATLYNLMAVLAALGLLALIVVAVRQVSHEAGFAQALRLDTSGSIPVWITVLLSLGAAITIDLIPLAFEDSFLPPTLVPGWWQDPLTIVLVLFSTLILVPIVETLLFQGIIYPALAAQWNNLQAIALTAGAFALVQVLPNPSDILWWVTSFLTGLFVTGLRAFEKSTRAAAVARIMFGVFTLAKAVALFG